MLFSDCFSLHIRVFICVFILGICVVFVVCLCLNVSHFFMCLYMHAMLDCVVLCKVVKVQWKGTKKNKKQMKTHRHAKHTHAHTYTFKQEYSEKKRMHNAYSQPLKYSYFFLAVVKTTRLFHSVLLVYAHTCTRTLTGTANYISLVYLIICLVVRGPCFECQCIASCFRVREHTDKGAVKC